MYIIVLTLHSYTRWLVLAAMLFALFRAWRGMLGQRAWARADDWAALTFTWVISLQFVLGVILYFVPNGMAQVAWRDLAAAMPVRDLRFFSLEHPIQMLVAITLVHLGSARSRRAHPAARQYRWAVICFTAGALLILAAIPWWRPLLRGL